jgi:hypothetical protein
MWVRVPTATKETREPSDAASLQAEDRFEQVIGLNHRCQQSLPLLQGLGRGPATDINGLFYWVLEDSLILHKVARAAGLESHGSPDTVETPYRGQIEYSCNYWVPLEDWKGETVYIEARGVNYIAKLPGWESPVR